MKTTPIDSFEPHFERSRVSHASNDTTTQQNVEQFLMLGRFPFKIGFVPGNSSLIGRIPPFFAWTWIDIPMKFLENHKFSSNSE